MSFLREMTVYWCCNLCGSKGPEFEGIASEFRPPYWLIGRIEEKGSHTLTPTQADLSDLQIAICPDCSPDWAKPLGRHGSNNSDTAAGGLEDWSVLESQ